MLTAAAAGLLNTLTARMRERRDLELFNPEMASVRHWLRRDAASSPSHVHVRNVLDVTEVGRRVKARARTSRQLAEDVLAVAVHATRQCLDRRGDVARVVQRALHSTSKIHKQYATCRTTGMLEIHVHCE